MTISKLHKERLLLPKQVTSIKFDIGSIVCNYGKIDGPMRQSGKSIRFSVVDINQIIRN